MTVSLPVAQRTAFAGSFHKDIFVWIAFKFNCFAYIDVEGHPHRAEDRNDSKSALRAKPTCSSVHGGPPDLQA